jgi:hypothetical protein
MKAYLIYYIKYYEIIFNHSNFDLIGKKKTIFGYKVDKDGN